jgi:hypothetical protein
MAYNRGLGYADEGRGEVMELACSSEPRCDHPAIGAARDGGDRAAVATEAFVDQMAVAGIPDAHAMFRQSGDQGLSVRAPVQAQKRVRGAFEAAPKRKPILVNELPLDAGPLGMSSLKRSW